MAETLRGQDEALTLLRAALHTGHTGHAYLFHGPSGVGKTRAALEFARALLCDARRPDGSPCDTCESCRMVLELRHPDLELLVPLPSFSSEGRTERQAEEARAEAPALIRARLVSDPYFLPIFARPLGHSLKDLPRAKQFLSMTARREGGAKDRKSTRLNSSHVRISYAVFCLKKKKNNTKKQTALQPELLQYSHRADRDVNVGR